MKSLCTLASVPLLLLSSVALAEDFSTPTDAVNAYMTGVKTGSGSHIESAFTDTARIQYYNEQGEYALFTRDEFAALVDRGENWEVTIEITDLPITGNAANATVEFTWGDKGQHGYVDYLNLINANGSWRIANKVAQYVPRD
ncbi:MAG: nuclear transport factor 2 family protein [Pseudomonadota bacterium]